MFERDSNAEGAVAQILKERKLVINDGKLIALSGIGGTAIIQELLLLKTGKSS